MIGIDLPGLGGRRAGILRSVQWGHPSVFDPVGAISLSLGLQTPPPTFFLDRGHRIRMRIVGAATRAGCGQALEQALSA